MQKKITSVLLVDDDPSCNFYHRRLLTKNQWTEHIHSVEDGQKAIDYLQSNTADLPDIIFLDINMPKVNGWDFLDAFPSLGIPLHQKPLIYMLTTSLNPDDRTKAGEYDIVDGFYEKFLTRETLQEIEKYLLT